MQVVGTTTQQEVWVASRDRKFAINEILIIHDEARGNPRGEVAETKSFNRYIPLATDQNPLVDSHVLAGLSAVGYNIGEEEVNLARLRIIDEASTPVAVGSEVIVPSFEQVKDLLVTRYPDEGLVLGSILGSEGLVDTLPGELAEVFSLYSPGKGVVAQNGVPFIFDYKSMNDYPHIGIFGGSGSGKSFGLRVLLEELMGKRIPGVVLDPHYEMDFRDSFPGLSVKYTPDYTGAFRVFLVGKDIGIDFPDLNTRELISLLGSGEQLSEAMGNAVGALHKTRDSFESFSGRLHMLIDAMENEKAPRRGLDAGGVHDEAFSTEVNEVYNKYRDKVGHVSSLKGLAWRLYSLERTGIFTSGTAPVESTVLDRKLAVIRGPVRLLQVYGAYLFDRLYLKRRTFRDAMQMGEKGEYFPPIFLITDEAHNFCMKGDRSTFSKRITRTIAQEGRKYGVQLVLATQRPALLDDTVTSQLNTKIIFRTVRSMDIATIKEETDIEAVEAARLPYLISGNAFISSAIMGRSIPVRIRCAGTVSPHVQNPFDELEEWAARQEDRFFNVVKDMLPLSAFNLNTYLPKINNALGETYSSNDILAKLEVMVAKGQIEQLGGPLGSQYVLKQTK